MPLPANFHSSVEEVLDAYPRTLVTVSCDQKNGELLGGHWAIYPPSPADYFVKCLCGCTQVYTVCNFEKHAGRGASKKWRESLRVANGATKQSLGSWIEDRCNAADAGLPEEGSRVIVYWPGAEGSKWHHEQVKMLMTMAVPLSPMMTVTGRSSILPWSASSWRIAPHLQFLMAFCMAQYHSSRMVA